MKQLQKQNLFSNTYFFSLKTDLMYKKIFTNLFLLSLATMSYSQVLLTEGFESSSLPVDWQNQSNATDGGWRFGTSQSLSSQNFGIESNGTSIAATNDDGCNCNKADEYLISKPIDLSDVDAAILIFDLFYTDQSYEGVQEDATAEISLDGINWTVLDDLHGHADWDEHIINISDYVGNATVYIGIRYNDNGGWLYGMAVDNISIEIPNRLDASLVALDSKEFGEIGKEFKISGTILNNGSESITSLEIQYTVDGQTPVIETLDGLSIDGFAFISFEFSQSWNPTMEGGVNISVEILKVNDALDEIADNNFASFSTVIYGEVNVPNKIVQIILSEPNITTIATGNNGLERPTDLDFFPVLGKDELWVINQRTENEGGSTVTISDATAETPSDIQMKVDGNSWHFMSLPTGIAFSSENFNFANSTGVQDANHSGGTFTGPALWSSDPDIYAQPSGGNGSHLDMLHGSPFCMGIAHEVDNVFWVYDDWNSDIVRYDFAEDHGPGNDDHADGRIRRYSNIGIQKDGDIPNHMILDKTSGWMYFVDNGNSRVMRLDINSGTIGATLPEINEPLAEHVRMDGFTAETIIDTGLDRPCGIELFKNYLLVGNYGTGDINVYDISLNFDFIGVIETGESGLTGIKLGPDGNIYAVNRINNSLVSITEGDPSSTVEYGNDTNISIYPNPTKDFLAIKINSEVIHKDASVKIFNTQGQQVYGKTSNSEAQIDVSQLINGIYFLEVNDSEIVYKNKFSIIK
ncbi:MAG: hypothetical protein ACI86M_002237 [Saprospiraceae bacterium]